MGTPIPSAANTLSAVSSTRCRFRRASAREPFSLTTGVLVPYRLSGVTVPIVLVRDRSMKGKTVLFTGASRGMGRFAAIDLARRGARILVVGHHEGRGAAAVQTIRGIGGSAEFLRADMGDAAEVRALAEAVLARSERIDVLIHSAGGIARSGARTREGVDRGFAQNFLGAFLLTRLLEERLLASAPARVIAVGSSTHRLVKSLDLDQFMRARNDLSRKSS